MDILESQMDVNDPKFQENAAYNRRLAEELHAHVKMARLSEQQQADFKRPILEKYEREGSPYHSTARLWDDGILDPVETR